MKRPRTTTICKEVPLVWSKLYGRYVQSDPCILKIGCPVCRARRGHGCKNKRGFVFAGTHYLRRYLVSTQPIFVYRGVGRLVEEGTAHSNISSSFLL